MPDRAWNKKEKYWSVPKDEETIDALKKLFGNFLKIDEGIFTSKVLMNEESNPIKKSVDSKSNSNPPILADTYFKTIQQGNRTFKVFVGEQIIIQKGKFGWLNVWVPYDKKGWISVLKNVLGRKWNIAEKCWEVPDVKTVYRHLKKHIGMSNLLFQFKISTEIPEEYEPPRSTPINRKVRKPSFFEKLNDSQQVAIKLMEEKLLLERLSYSTLKTYRHHLAGLLYYFKETIPQKITNEQVEQYLLHQIKHKKIAESTQNQIINAVKAYWEKVLKRDKAWIQIQRPKKPKKLPNVLSKEEIIQLLNSVENLKHKLILLLIYSSGLRLGEVVNLLVKDINIHRRHLHIKGGKGKKDRYVALAETVLPFLEDYKKQYRPTRWLIEGQYGGKYSKRSVQNIFKKAVRKSKVNAYATVHTLRHSYATHCVEDGHNLKAVQDALGHESPETTQIYLHLSATTLKKLKSPIDALKINKK